MANPLTPQDRAAILYNMRHPVDGLWPLTEIVERYETTLVALLAAGYRDGAVTSTEKP